MVVWRCKTALFTFIIVFISAFACDEGGNGEKKEMSLEINNKEHNIRKKILQLTLVKKGYHAVACSRRFGTSIMLASFKVRPNIFL